MRCEVNSEEIWKLLERAVGVNLKDLPVLAEKLCTVAKAKGDEKEEDTDEEAVKETERELKLSRVHFQ